MKYSIPQTTREPSKFRTNLVIQLKYSVYPRIKINSKGLSARGTRPSKKEQNDETTNTYSSRGSSQRPRGGGGGGGRWTTSSQRKKRSRCYQPLTRASRFVWLYLSGRDCSTVRPPFPPPSPPRSENYGNIREWQSPYSLPPPFPHE